MSLFDDAAAFMKDRKTEPQEENQREALINKIRREFENATRLEVERALDRLAEQGEIPKDFDILLKKIRIWLED